MNARAIVPPISSKLWPRLIIAVGVLLAVAVVAVAAKTRFEVVKTRETARTELERRIRDRSRADRLEAAWNPGHRVPMTEDVFGGVPDDLVRETPVDPMIVARSPHADESTQIKIEWTSPRQVHAMIDRCTGMPRTDDAFAHSAVADYVVVAEAIPPVEAR